LLLLASDGEGNICGGRRQQLTVGCRASLKRTGWMTSARALAVALSGHLGETMARS